MRILVLRIGRVGDMVMITPALDALLERFPDAEIDVLTNLDGKRVLKNKHPRISNIIIYDRHSWMSYFIKQRFTKELRKVGYDKVFCFENRPSLKEFAANIAKQGFYISDADQHQHFAKRCLNVVNQAVELDARERWVSLTVDEDCRQQAKEYFHQQAGIEESDIVIGLHPTFSGLRRSIFRPAKKAELALRQWPFESFATLAKMLRDHAQQTGQSIKIIMDLLPDEQTIGEKIMDASDGAVILLTPQPNFEAYKARLARLNLLVTLNTGPMHLAAAIKTPIVALFCGYHPNDCGPYMPENLYSVLRAEDCTDAEKGLAAIEPQAVFQACRNHLE